MQNMDMCPMFSALAQSNKDEKRFLYNVNKL